MAERAQRVGPGVQRQLGVEAAAQKGRVAVGDRVGHGQHRGDPTGEQLTGQARQRRLTLVARFACFARLGGLGPSFRQGGGAAGQDDQRHPPVGGQRLGGQPLGAHRVGAAIVVLKHQPAWPGMARQVQDMEPLLRERLAQLRQRGSPHDPHRGTAGAPGRVDGVQDAP